MIEIINDTLQIIKYKNLRYLHHLRLSAYLMNITKELPMSLRPIGFPFTTFKNSFLIFLSPIKVQLLLNITF